MVRPANIIQKEYGVIKDSYVLYLGRLVPKKGVKNLIDTFKQVDTNKKLVIAGGASDIDDFMNNLQSETKEDYRIMFTGFV